MEEDKLTISRKIFRLWLLFIIGIILANLLSSAVISNILGWDLDMFWDELLKANTKAINTQYFLFIFQQLFIFLFTAIFWVKMFNDGDFADVGIKFKINRKYILYAIGIVLIGLPIMEWIIEWNQNIKFPERFGDLEKDLKTMETANEDIVAAFLGDFTPLKFFVNLLVLALIPAICEELFFRGALQGVMLKKYKSIHGPIIFIALLFSLFHSSFYGFVPRFLLGAIFGYMTVWSGSVLPAIVAHFTNNAISVIGSYYMLGNNIEEVPGQEGGNIIIPLLSFILTVGLIIIFYRNKVSLKTT